MFLWQNSQLQQCLPSPEALCLPLNSSAYPRTPVPATEPAFLTDEHPDGLFIPAPTCIPTQRATMEASSRDLGLSLQPPCTAQPQSAMLGSTSSSMSLSSQDVLPALALPPWPRLLLFLVTSLDCGGIPKALTKTSVFMKKNSSDHTLWPTPGQALGAPESRADRLQPCWLRGCSWLSLAPTSTALSHTEHRPPGHSGTDHGGKPCLCF